MDKRLIKTKETLKKALGELLLNKDISKITIKELTDKSGINRGTFYLHYKDINDLINEIENELIINLIASTSSDIDLDKSEAILFQLMKMLDYVKKEKLYFRVLTSHHGDIVFLQKLRQALLDEFISFMPGKEEYDSDALKFFFTFIISGGIGVFQEWLRSDCTLPYATVINPCELIIRQSTMNFQLLKKKN